MAVQKTPSSWSMVDQPQWDEEIVVVTPRGTTEVIVLDEEDRAALVVKPHEEPAPQLEQVVTPAGTTEVFVLDEEDRVAFVVKAHEEPAPQLQQRVAAAALPRADSMKLSLKGRTVIFCGMSQEDQAKEFADAFENLFELIIRDDQIVCCWLKAQNVPRLKELIGYFRERAEKMSDKDAVDYAIDMAEWFAEPRSYLLEVNFLPKLMRLTKGSLNRCLRFEIIDCLSNYLHYLDLTPADVFCESEDELLLAPPPAAVIETSAAEAIIDFLETEEEPPFLSPGKEVFIALLALFKPLKEKLLQICTVEELSDYLDEVDKNSKYPCPFQCTPEIQIELTAFLTLYIKHRSTPLCTEEEPPSLIEVRAQSLEQLQESAFAALEKVVHAAGLNITIDLASNVVRLEKNGVSQDVSHPESDDDFVPIN